MENRVLLVKAKGNATVPGFLHGTGCRLPKSKGNYRRGETPYVGFPRRHRPPDAERHPLPALWEEKAFRLLREAAKGPAFGNRGL